MYVYMSLCIHYVYFQMPDKTGDPEPKKSKKG